HSRLAARRGSAIGRIGLDRLCQLVFPAVAVGQQALLVVEQLLASLGGELEVGAVDVGADRAGLLAEAAGDALHHVDVVARRAAAAVGARLGRDGDRERRAGRLAELAGDAALLAAGIAAQRVRAAEARRDRALLVGIVQRHLGAEEIAQG